MSRRSSRQGWHREDIKAALRKRGWNFRRIGREYGYSYTGSPGDVLRYRWPFMERVVADILEISPAKLWPERYRPDGSPIGTGIKREYSKFPHDGNRATGAA